MLNTFLSIWVHYFSFSIKIIRDFCCAIFQNCIGRQTVYTQNYRFNIHRSFPALYITTAIPKTNKNNIPHLSTFYKINCTDSSISKINSIKQSTIHMRFAGRFYNIYTYKDISTHLIETTITVADIIPMNHRLHAHAHFK